MRDIDRRHSFGARLAALATGATTDGDGLADCELAGPVGDVPPQPMAVVAIAASKRG